MVKRLRPLPVNILLTFASLFFCLLLMEGVLRLGLIGNPLHSHLRTAGERKNPRMKLLILGDSFIYKGGTLDRLLIEALAPKGVQILNLAVPGMGPLDYLDELRAHGKAFGPEAVMLCYFAGNDLTNVKYHRTVNGGTPSKFKNFLRPGLRKSYLYHFFLQLKSNLKQFDYDKMGKEGVDTALISLARAGKVNPFLLSIEPGRRVDLLTSNLLMETAGDRQAFSKILELLEKSRSLSEKMNAKFLLAVFPDAAQVNRAPFDFYGRAGIKTDDRLLTENVPQALLMDFGKTSEIPVLDLLPDFRGRTGEFLYGENDLHFNVEGNALAARRLVEFLK